MSLNHQLSGRGTAKLAVISLIALLAISTGATAKPATSKKHGSGKNASTKVVNKSRPGGTHVDVTPSSVKVSSRVEGGSTGDGPLTDEECQELANDVNHSLDEMEDALLDGDDKGAQAWSGIANTVADTGLDGGCFFTGIE